MTTHLFTPPGAHQRPGRLVRRSILSLTAAALLVGTVSGVAAADESGDSTEANVGVASGITMTGLSPSFLLTGTPGATVTGNDVVSFNVETNNVAGYTVTVEATEAEMLPADVVANVDSIPIGDLTVFSAAGAYEPLSDAAPVLVHTQSERSANGGDALASDFRIRIPVVNADTYSATLDYVATTL